MTFNIYLTGDAGECVSTYVKINEYEIDTYCSPAQFRSYLEPTIAAIKQTLKAYIKHYLDSGPVTVKIGENKLICIVEKRNGRFMLNGKGMTNDVLLTALAKTIYLSTTTNEPIALFNKLYEAIDLPENVTFALENRVPYHWFENYKRIKVSLNVIQISNKECAIEISDNIWGTISIKDLNTFMNYYRLGKRRGSWKMLSPASLWGRLMGKDPTESQLILMKAFLMQNRTQDIVEERAEQLLKDLLNQYPDKLKLVIEKTKDRNIRHIYVRGKLADWLLIESAMKQGYQLVSTYLFTHDEKKIKCQNGYWDGPICIDNLNDKSSVGDQFATRAIALMNDYIILKRVSTLSRRLKDFELNQKEIRVDFDEL
tara:strand:- start:183 stop:1292 length:1110 start_codon:yes stop_codon:yes gene_type:complete